MKKNRWLMPMILAGMLSMGLQCEKDENEACTEIKQAPQEFLNCWYFPEGSWWEYQLKDSGGVYDKVTVIYQHEEYYEPNSADVNHFGVKPCVKYYQTTWQHSNEKYYPRFDSLPIYENLFADHFQFGDTWRLHSSVTSIYRHPTDIFQYLYFSNFVANDEIRDIYKSDSIFSIDNQEYSGFIVNFYDTDFPGDSTTGDFLKSLHLVPEIGVVRKIYSNNQVWELQKFNLIKN